ncbi:MAG: hypothetical protein RMA76_13220 [Deltaproteobacteria bacterium]|jgi:hypothetical protein
MKRAALLLLLTGCGTGFYDDDGGCGEPTYRGLFTAQDGRTALVSAEQVLLTHPDGTTEELFFDRFQRPAPTLPTFCGARSPADGFRRVRLQGGSKAAFGSIWLEALEGATIVSHEVDFTFDQTRAENRYTVTATATRVAIDYMSPGPIEADVRIRHALRLAEGSTVAETLDLRLERDGDTFIKLTGTPCR